MPQGINTIQIYNINAIKLFFHNLPIKRRAFLSLFVLLFILISI